MTSSLVGSEMCIRDRLWSEARVCLPGAPAEGLLKGTPSGSAGALAWHGYASALVCSEADALHQPPSLVRLRTFLSCCV
eukprot:7654019-Prorocentrum_lima.AAC.1